MSVVVLDHLGGLEAAARLVGGQLDDLLVDDPSRPRVGAIFRAACDRPVKGQGGMFLRLPEGGTAFLRGAKGLAPGQTLLVQVTGHAEAGKAVPVTERLLFKSRYAIVTPGAPGLNVSRAIRDEEERVRLRALAEGMVEEGLGLILRSAAQGAEEDAIAEDIAAMADLARAVLGDAAGPPEALTEGDGPHVLAWRDWPEPARVVTEPGGFETEGVLDQVEALRRAEVALGPADMSVEETRALVAVDVNTRGDTSPAAGLKANLAAAKALPRALRLRGLGGQIVVDFAPMPKAHRREVETALKAAFRADPVETSAVGWTPLGHYELQRKRERASLAAVLKELP
ncbi:ribonuclease E/G [Histidinibacterium lentulum]|uniref:Ribonuclease G n=1 Tax=Histidinibacterium lentulum TaxID=2480588 RepID=A0A3N2QWK5_9RHOB|nr:ribonuclease E/G [Histidinibacterium lentulum]ROT99519.1 ribonuclease G [Histidinibacterium lentulum]